MIQFHLLYAKYRISSPTFKKLEIFDGAMNKKFQVANTFCFIPRIIRYSIGIGFNQETTHMMHIKKPIRKQIFC